MNLFRCFLMLCVVAFYPSCLVFSQNSSIAHLIYSNDSSAISGMIMQQDSIFFRSPKQVSQQLVFVNGVLIMPERQSGYIVQKIVSAVNCNDGIQLQIKFVNISKDTLGLQNVLPFQLDAKQVYITGLGSHSLSRTHLFLPERQPVNVIVPDNAWELGFNTIALNDSFHIYGFSRRIKESIHNGKSRRFETILYPGGTIDYSIWIEPYSGNWQSAILKVFQLRKLYDVANFNDSLYKRSDLSWIRHAYAMHLMMSWDKFFYDPVNKKYRISEFVNRGNKLYGGDDIVSIWPTWPTLGLDQRNQFDLFKDLPGGTNAIKKISDQLRSQGKHLFVSYNPWDVDTRAWDHYKGLSWLIDHTNADGVVLDTQGSSSKALQNAADSVRNGVIMYSEGMAVPKDMQGIISGRVHNALYYPPMLNLNKFIQPGFAIFRVAELYKEPIQREFATSFFNGYGTELNIMAPGQPAWVDQQYSFFEKTTRLLKNFSANFNSANAIPLIETNRDSIWVNKWPTPEKTVYTIYSIIPQGVKQYLFKVENRDNWHYVDVYHHKLLTPVKQHGDYYIEVETDAFHEKFLKTNNEGSVDCILHTPKLIEVKLKDNYLKLELNNLNNIDTAQVSIHIYKSSPSSTNKPVLLKYKNQSIFIQQYFGRFEGNLVIQVIRNEEGRNTLLDEQVLELKSGIPRIVSAASASNTGLTSKNGMVKIPAGNFKFKQTHGDDFIPYPSDADTSILQMKAYWMDAYPVTNEAYYEFIKQSHYTPSDKHNYLKHWNGNKPLTSDLKKPVTFISIEDAKAYAQFYNKDLPTEIEWQYAAQTDQLNEWPWKQLKPVSRTYEDVTETLSVIQIHGIDSTQCNLGNGKLDIVGAYPKGINPFGLYDLVGSVWQLTRDIYATGSYQYIIMKGGSYFKPSGSWWYVQSGPRELTYAQYLLRISPGFERNATVGFRCISRD